MARVASRIRLARATGAVALLAGGLLYLARPTDPAVFGWLDRGLHPLAQVARALRHAVYAHVHLPAWFRGSASDVAYAFALGALLADAPASLVALGMIVVLGHEVAQGLGLVAGTFDVADLALLFVSFIGAQVAFRPLAPQGSDHEPQDLVSPRHPPRVRAARRWQLLPQEGRR
jgi:hypothetical protein